MTCPICHREFDSDDCPHSTNQVEDFRKVQEMKKILGPFIGQIVREELAKLPNFGGPDS